jgi:hypothetical protein
VRSEAEPAPFGLTSLERIMRRVVGSFLASLFAGALEVPVALAESVSGGRGKPITYTEPTEPAVAGPTALGEWEYFSATPPRTFGAPAVYDRSRHRMVVVSGIRPFLEETAWALSLSPSDRTWRRIDAQGQPPADQNVSSAIYDPIGDRVLTLSFHRLGGGKELRALTFAGEPSWSLVVSREAMPVPGDQHGFVYDSRRREVVVFGGSRMDLVSSAALPSASTWITRTITGTPPAFSFGFAAVYDSLRDRVLVLSEASELWSLSLGSSPAWQRVEPPLPRSSNTAASMSLDPERDRLLVVADRGYSHVPAQVWEFDIGQSTWRELTFPAGRPAPEVRLGPSVIWNPLDRRLMLHSGSKPGSGFYFADTWELEAEEDHSWREWVLAPPIKRGSFASYDALRRRLLVFGGVLYEIAAYFEYDIRLDSRLWSLSTDGAPRWSELPGTLERKGAQVVFDDQRRRAVGLGGYLPRSAGCSPHDALIPGYTGDAWSYDLTSDGWGPPLPGGGHTQEFSAVLDPFSQRIVTFGGTRWTLLDCGHTAWIDIAHLNQVRALSLTAPSQWATLAAQGSAPPAQTAHLAVVDEDRRSMIVLGGHEAWSNYFLNQVWELSLGPQPTWRHRVTSGTPPPITTWGGRSAVYDPVRERVLVVVANLPTSIWALSLRSDELRWERLEFPGARLAPGSPYAAYDAELDQIIVYRDESGEVGFLRWGDPLKRVELDPVPHNPNDPLNPDSRGLLHLAILSEPDLDATQVDPMTVTVSGATVARTPKGHEKAGVRDVNADGRDDLVVSIRVPELESELGTEPIRLDARTHSGRLVRGYAELKPVGRRFPHEDAQQAGATLRPASLKLESFASAGTFRLSMALVDDAPASIEVFDILGRRVEARTVDRSTLELVLPSDGQKLPPGLYLLRLRQGVHSVTARSILFR